ncbi:MAG: hypothetical protein ABII26_12425 [Pseudomonadota bacterium]
MYLLYKSMAIFWTLSEALILVFIRWGLLFLKKREGRQRRFLISAALIFGALAGLLFFGEVIFGGILDLQSGLNLPTYRWALWNFFCTLWVILEGSIMIYGIRIYGHLRFMLKSDHLQKNIMRPDGDRFILGIPLLISSLFFMYLFYQHSLLSVIDRHGIDAESLYHISMFYIRICGIFWIIFEWIIAVLVIRIYGVLKGAGET